MRRPAPALLAAALGALLLFAILTAVVVLRPGALTGFDETASSFAALYRAPRLLSAFFWLTTLGTGAALFGIAVTASGFLWAARRTGLILPLWVAFAGAQASVWAAKYAVGRTRPVFFAGGASAFSPSFPSAHATGTVATIGFVAYAVARTLPGRRDRFQVALAAAILVTLVDVSRIFLGVHFATDVVGGFLLGGAWLLIGLALAEPPRWVVSNPGPPS